MIPTKENPVQIVERYIRENPECFKAAQSLIGKMNRAKAKPENMSRGDSDEQATRRKVNAIARINKMRRSIDIECGHITPDVAQAAKEAGISITEL